MTQINADAWRIWWHWSNDRCQLVVAMNRSVFVVDDDDAVRDSLKTLLELQSFTVMTFETCQDFLTSGSDDAACLVLDIHLAGMSGFDLMEAMKRMNRGLPTILITGRCDNAIRDRAKALGAVALLEKPIDFADLMTAINRCVNSSVV